MRLAYLIHQDPRRHVGGSETYALNLARAAAGAGHRVLVISRGQTHGLSEWQEAHEGIEYVMLDELLRSPRGQRFGLRHSFDDSRASAMVIQRLREFRPHRFHVHHFLMTSARVALRVAALGIGVTATWHDYWAFCHRLTWQLPDGTDCPGAQGGLRCRHCGKEIYNRWPGRVLQPLHAAGFVWRNNLLRRAYGAMRRIFVPSRAVLDAHVANGFPADKLIYLPYGLPRLARATKRKPATPRRVAFLGRLAPEKGVELLLAALREAGSGMQLLVFGRGEAAYEQKLHDQAAGLPVRFHGAFERADLSRVLAAVDVVAVPSLWRENLPLVVLEAAQHGVPALVAPRGGLLETPALCGARVVAEQTPSAWAAALRTAADDAAWREWQAAMHYDRHIEEDLALHLQAGRRP